MKDLSIDKRRKLDTHILEASLIAVEELRLTDSNGIKYKRDLIDGGRIYKVEVVVKER